MDLKTKETKLESFFSEEVVKNYNAFLSRNMNLEDSLITFMHYLLKHNIIRPRTVKHYSVLSLYPKELYEANGRKMQAVQSIEDQTGYGQTTIFTILKDQKQFWPK